MTNADVAKIFHEIGDILELQNENPFRVRAYRQAAKAIEFHPDSLAHVYKTGGREALMAIPGVGEALADKVIEILDTGHLKAYEKLSAKMPKAELEIAGIPGVGPKTAKKIYQYFKPKSLAELKEKLEAVKFDKKSKASVAGLHEKSIANILRGIEILKNQTGRMLITDALPIADAITSRLKNLPGTLHVDPVGSLRRMQETIGDVDIIAAAKDPQKLIDAFCETPGVSDVLANGQSKAMVIFNGKAHVDLEILPKEEYGSLLQHFTGSKEHNIAFRSLATDLGLSFSEHGFKVTSLRHAWAKKAVAQAKKDKRWDAARKLILCHTEEQVYEAVGLAWIPPELRENAGEIVAAQNHTLPNLIELKDIKGDIHVHSQSSGDGREKPEALIERAIALGYKYLGITDHTEGLGVAGKLSNRQLAKHAEQLRKLNKKYPEIRILPGCELNILASGKLDVPDSILKQLDIVIASVHTAFAQNIEVMTKRILSAIENPHVDILAHPTTRVLGYREEISADWEQIFKRAAETKTALEINAYPQRLDLDGPRIRRAKELGCQFVISTDTHQLLHLDNMRYGVAMARRGWCEKEDILNSQSLGKIDAWLKR